jgi:hypothetical protein
MDWQGKSLSFSALTDWMCARISSTLHAEHLPSFTGGGNLPEAIHAYNVDFPTGISAKTSGSLRNPVGGRGSLTVIIAVLFLFINKTPRFASFLFLLQRQYVPASRFNLHVGKSYFWNASCPHPMAIEEMSLSYVNVQICVKNPLKQT